VTLGSLRQWRIQLWAVRAAARPPIDQNLGLAMAARLRHGGKFSLKSLTFGHFLCKNVQKAFSFMGLRLPDPALPLDPAWGSAPRPPFRLALHALAMVRPPPPWQILDPPLVCGYVKMRRQSSLTVDSQSFLHASSGYRGEIMSKVFVIDSYPICELLPWHTLSPFNIINSQSHSFEAFFVRKK